MMRFVSNLHSSMIVSLVLFAPIFYLGIGGKYPWVLLGKYGIGLGMISFFILTLCFFLMSFIRYGNVINETLFYKIFNFNLILSILVAIAYDLIQYKHFLRFAYQQPTMLYVLSILAIIVIFLSIKLEKTRCNALWIFVICASYSSLHYLGSIYYFPLTEARSDMLPAISLSIQHFYDGFSPYHKSIESIGVPPYLPFTMISFIPAYLWNIDFRFITLVYWIISMVLIAYKINKFTMEQVCAICLFVINPYFLMRHEMYYQIFLLEMIVICLYLQYFNYAGKVIIFGVFISTLQFAWILMPFIILADSKSKSEAITKFILSTAIGFLISLIYIGINQTNLADFIKAMFLHKEYNSPYSSDITFGLSTVFYFAKSQVLLYIMQILSCLSIILYSIYLYIVKGNRSHNMYLSMSAICYMIFMTTNYFIETYLLAPLILYFIVSYKNENSTY
ncbi:MAG: hypothetical protein PHC75_00520 [Burkholderiales bacterium]|nr:hypothetical protein [Burkholderiales bacterium]